MKLSKLQSFILAPLSVVVLPAKFGNLRPILVLAIDPRLAVRDVWSYQPLTSFKFFLSVLSYWSTYDSTNAYLPTHYLDRTAPSTPGT